MKFKCLFILPLLFLLNLSVSASYSLVYSVSISQEDYPYVSVSLGSDGAVAVRYQDLDSNDPVLNWYNNRGDFIKAINNGYNDPYEFDSNQLMISGSVYGSMELHNSDGSLSTMPGVGYQSAYNNNGVIRNGYFFNREGNEITIYQLTNQFSGSQGPQGPQGPQGAQGPQGLKGDTGAQGPQGLQGLTGYQGAQGIQGVRGEKGDTGAQGIMGLKGDKGDQGIQGAKGDKGDTGAPGAQGPQGPQGLRGDTGNTGAQGPQGVQGIMGLKGDKGDQGAKGEKGDTGPQGPQGPPGLDSEAIQTLKVSEPHVVVNEDGTFNVQYTVQSSDDLSTWTNEEIIDATISPENSGKQFLRIGVDGSLQKPDPVISLPPIIFETIDSFGPEN